MDAGDLTMTIRHNDCVICTITPARWWMLAGLLASILGFVAKIYAADHDFISKASAEIPAITLTAQGQEIRLRTVEQNTASIQEIQKDVREMRNYLINHPELQTPSK
jgi:hypothetical protein